MVEHAEIQTCGSIVTIGAGGIVAATFLTGQEYLKNLVWYFNPLTYFLTGGLFVIIAGCVLFFWYIDKEREWAIDFYSYTIVIGLTFIIIAASQTIIRFIFSQ